MNYNNYEEIILSISDLLEKTIIKTDNYNKQTQSICLDNKIKENMQMVLSNLLHSKELISNTLYEIRYNNCFHDLHDYIDDLIDINPELSKKIIYCKHCGVLKNE
jgi:hypothetical protein